MKRIGSLLTPALLFVVMIAPVQAQQFGGVLAIGDDEVLVSETRNQAFPGIVYVYQRGADGDKQLDHQTWQAQLEALAARGQRVLAVAAKPGPGERESLAFDDLRGGLVLLGLFGLIDPPRDEAVAAV